MRKLITLFLVLWFVPAFGADEDAVAAVGEVLDAFHDAASRADGALYFSLFAQDAIFIGTDATERWPVDEFKAFAEPYFSEGRGWTYNKTERHVYVAADGHTAWFDEMLWNEKYGTCRGTGVLVRTANGWRIAQYHLTFPIPNDLSAEITSRIKEIQEK
jgi:ketosteroid isomerase-like protein